MSHVTAESATGDVEYVAVAGGWCVHGIPYGPNWSCSQCGSLSVTHVSYGTTPPAFTAQDVSDIKQSLRHIISLLEVVARVAR